MNRKLLVILLAVLAEACATTRQGWMAAGATGEARESAFSVQVPAGWMRLRSEGSLVMTRDGPLLQRITVTRTDVGRPLANPRSVLVAGMPPQEAAEVIAADLSSGQALVGAKVVENVPANVGGLPGFRLTLTYRDRGGLGYRLVLYGALSGSWVYRLTYVAPERHYFELDRATFEDVARSFRPARAGSGAPHA